MNKTLKSAVNSSDACVGTLNLVLDLVDVLKKEVKELEEITNALSNMEFTLGYNRETNKIFCGPLTNEGNLEDVSQDRTVEVLTTVLAFLNNNGKSLIIKNKEGESKFKLVLEEF